jgi:hypothetical protein
VPVVVRLRQQESRWKLRHTRWLRRLAAQFSLSPLGRRRRTPNRFQTAGVDVDGAAALGVEVPDDTVLPRSRPVENSS